MPRTCCQTPWLDLLLLEQTVSGTLVNGHELSNHEWPVGIDRHQTLLTLWSSLSSCIISISRWGRKTLGGSSDVSKSPGHWKPIKVQCMAKPLLRHASSHPFLHRMVKAGPCSTSKSPPLAASYVCSSCIQYVSNSTSNMITVYLSSEDVVQHCHPPSSASSLRYSSMALTFQGWMSLVFEPLTGHCC